MHFERKQTMSQQNHITHRDNLEETQAKELPYVHSGK